MRLGALEAGGTKMVCAIGNEQGEIFEQISIPTQTPEITIPRIIEYFKDKEIEALGVTCRAYAGNAADFAETETVVKQIHADFGSIDILVNNAGITKDGLMLRMSEAQWDAVLNVNLKSAFNFKAGMIGLAKSIAQELGPKGVRANCVAPGFIETPMTAQLSEEIRKGWMAKIPLRRGGQTEDIANVCLFLASDLSSYVSGQVIQVDGGMNM